MTREEAIQVLRDWDGYFIGHSSDDVNGALNMAIKALEQTRWIPVSERLPEKKGTYLVTQKAIFPGHILRRIVGYAHNLYDVDEYDFADKKRPGWYEYDSEWGYRELEDITAWMPLPTPFEAESEE